MHIVVKSTGPSCISIVVDLRRSDRFETVKDEDCFRAMKHGHTSK